MSEVIHSFCFLLIKSHHAVFFFHRPSSIMENPDPDPSQQPNPDQPQEPDPDQQQQPNPDPPQQHVCRKCGKVLGHQSSKSRHEKSCSLKVNPVSKVKKTYVCTNSWCNAIFGKIGNRNRHLLTCHKKIKPKHVCTTCGKVFEKESKLLRHLPTHDKPSFKCDRCFTTFRSEKRFQKHDRDRCQPPSSTVMSALADRPTMIEDNFQTDDNCQNDNTLGFDDERSAEIDFAAVGEWIGESSHPCSSSSYDNSCTSSSFACTNTLMNVHSPQCPSSPIDADTSVASHPCSSSFVEAFEHVQINSSGTSAAISTETPPVYILEDEHLHDCQMFESMEFLHASPSPSYSKEYSYTKEQFERTVTGCTIKHLKSLKHKSKRSSVMQREFASLCVMLFKKKTDDLEFMDSLAADLGFSSREELIDLINSDTPKLTPRGRPMSGITERQLAYDFWRENSDISNDRRNARHMVKIKPSKRDRAIQDLVDDSVKECHTKGGVKLKAQKYIYNGTINELHKKFKNINPEVSMSSTLFYRCRPFYVAPPTAREMESCLCAKCLNPHSLYSTLRRNMDDLPQSLSEYLTMFFECQQDSRLNFPKLSCIQGECKNKCHIADETGEQKYSEVWEKKVSYYQFLTVEVSYWNKEGVKKFYTRTARKDYTDVPLKDVYKVFQESARSYLVHRYHTLLDKVYWQQYIDENSGAIVWMDYSQNVNLTEKNQTQSAHFSGQQQTLHDTLILLDGKHQYIYHLSDDTNHDSVMTLNIIEDVIQNHPEVIKTGRLTLRSDNCSSQYKCRFVFKGLLDLAKKYNIRIDFFYGEAGHGRGLIDAMAWFGAKGPMRKHIILTDKWFEDARQMVHFLDEKFREDETKEYHYVDPSYTAALRRLGREERKIKGCSFAHVISFYPDGTQFKKWLTVKDFMDDTSGTTVTDEDHEEIEDEQLPVEEVQELPEWHDTIDHMDRYDMIEVGSFVAIRSEKGELFHLMKVEEKKIAEESFMDPSGEHGILKREPYLVCKWYSFQKESKKFALFSPQSANTMKSIVHMGEIFSTDLTLNEKNQMDIFEYRMLLSNAS